MFDLHHGSVLIAIEPFSRAIAFKYLNAALSFRPQRVVACIVRRGELFLLCQRPAHKRHGGMWEFPGGKAEENESDASAAERELHEELDVQLVSASPAIFEI